MFTINLRKDLYVDDANLCAKAMTLDNALGFVRTFTVDGMTIESNWKEHDGWYVMDVYDWEDCWGANPPVLAQITAPIGFLPLGAANTSV